MNPDFVDGISIKLWRAHRLVQDSFTLSESQLQAYPVYIGDKRRTGAQRVRNLFRIRDRQVRFCLLWEGVGCHQACDCD